MACTVLAALNVHSVEKVGDTGKNCQTGIQTPFWRVCPGNSSPEQMARRKPVGSPSVIRVSPRDRVEVGIHPVVELPVHSHPKTSRDVDVKIRAHLCLGSIPHGKPCTIDINLAQFESRVVIVDACLNVILPSPTAN